MQSDHVIFHLVGHLFCHADVENVINFVVFRDNTWSLGSLLKLYTLMVSMYFFGPTDANVACIDQGPVQVIVTGIVLPLRSSSDSRNTSLFVGVRPFQRPLTFSSTGLHLSCRDTLHLSHQRFPLAIVSSTRKRRIFSASGTLSVEAPRCHGSFAGGITGKMCDVQPEIR